MISLEFEQAVGYYVLFFIVLFVGGWTFSLFRDKKSNYTKEFKLWQCSICTFVYSTVFAQDITTCPRCGSYNKKSDEDQIYGTE